MVERRPSLQEPGTLHPRPRFTRRYRGRRPAYQSSWTPTWPGSTPKLRSCGRSRTRRLSSAKPRKLARPQDVVPQRDGLGLAGQAADHRAEEPDAARGLEVDDRCPDVLAGQRQGLVRLAAQLGVERGVVQRVGEFGRQAGPRQDVLEEGPDAAGLIAARVPPGPKCSARSRSPTPVTPGNKSGRASEHGPSEYARSPIGTPAPPATPHWGTPAQCAAGRRSGHARRQAARSVVGLLVKQMSAPGSGRWLRRRHWCFRIPSCGTG